MGQRERKRRKQPVAQPARRGPDPSRSRAKDDAVRAELKPLQPGERPTAVTVAAIVAVVLGVAEPILALTGVAEGSPVRSVLFLAVMLAAAWGMWHGKYWAVLGFQALLALSLLFAFTGLATASNLAAVGLCLAIILPGGLLFWKLVRAMARIQMPQRGVS